MADVAHSGLTTTDLHVPGRVQSSDPGTVGPGHYWVDTSRLVSTGYVFLKVRNSTDSDWIPLAVGSLISADGVYSATAQQVRQHIDDDDKHREIDDTGSAVTDLWSANKIAAELAPLDTHVATAALHRVINDSGASSIELWSAAKIIAQLALKQNAVSAGQLVPPGTIISFAGEGVPSGYLHCAGGQISRTVYSDLFAAIGTSWGYGNGTTTFHVPDLVGRFIRMKDYGWGRDPDRLSRSAANAGGASGDAVGSIQGHQFYSHVHGFYQWGIRWFTRTNFTYTGTGEGVACRDAGNYGMNGYAGGNETRPINAYVNFCIKY